MLGALALGLFFALLGISGLTVSAWLWSRSAGGDAQKLPGKLEGIASALIFSASIWVALNWSLSPFHAIRAWALLIAAAGLAIGSLAYLRADAAREGGVYAFVRRLTVDVRISSAPATWLMWTPLTVWIAYVAWRCATTPIVTHDALSYHLPRAMDVVRTGTWRYLPVEDFRLAWFPSDYELMLADVIALTGSGPATLVVPILTYLAAFVFCAAWGERRWGSGVFAWVGAFVWAGTPLALLHSGAHKNDIMVMMCSLSVALWGARWLVEGGAAPLVLALLGLALGVGTKVSCISALPAALVAFAPFGLFSRVKATFSTPARVATLIVGSLVLLALLGVAPIIAHLCHPHLDSDMGMTPADMVALNITPHYGGWSNLWRFPVLLWLRPFSASTTSMAVPWLHAAWFWPKYEIYYGDFGMAVSALAALVPIALLLRLERRQRTEMERDADRERAAASLFLVLLMVAILPMQYKLDGAVTSFVRYVFFVPLLVVDWGLIPLLRRIGAPRSQALVATTFIAGASLFFVEQGIDVAMNDAFLPFRYIVTRLSYVSPLLPLNYRGRAAQIMNMVAGPNDHVAIEGDFGAWIYPAYGDDLTRTVTVLPLQREARGPIVDDADWVAIDRYWAICWGAPTFTDMSHAFESFDHGKMGERDLEFYHQMMKDPRFSLFSLNLRNGQILFHRRHGPRG